MTSPGSVLRKKLRPRKPERGRSHIALERRADDLFRRATKDAMGLDLLVASANVAPMPRAVAFEQMPDVAAWYILADGSATLGFALLDGTTLDALIEFETLGRVTSAPRGQRPVTRIDARIGQRLLDCTLEALAQMIPGSPEMGFTQPYRTARQEWDRPTLDLALDLPAYNVMTVELDFGPGGKTGQVQMWFPGSNLPVQRSQCAAEQNPEMHSALADVETRLDTRVKGIRVPLSTLARLTVGSEIRLPADCLTRVVIMEPSGREVLSARLGQLNGARALRITGPARGKPKPSESAAGAMAGFDLMNGAPELALPNAAPELAAPDMGTPEIAMPDMPAADFPVADMPAADLGAATGLPQADIPMMAEPMGSSGALDEMPADGFAAAPISLD